MQLTQIVYLVGMPRAGTTFLYHNLELHPRIYVPFRRKTNFFSLHRDQPVAWFLEHFSGMDSEQVGIDTETLHFVDRENNALSRIAAFNSDAKVILVVRHPGEWVWSFYKQIQTFDKDMPPFGDFLTGKYTLVEDGREIPFNFRDGDIESRINEVRNTFGKNALVLNFDLLARDPRILLTEIEAFLKIEDCFRSLDISHEKINASDRGHIRSLAYLLRQEWLIGLLKVLPRGLVLFCRRFYDGLSVKFASNPRKNAEEAARNIEIARKFFASDEKFVATLFRESDVLHG